MEQPVLEIDKVLICVQFILPHIVQIGGDVLERFIDLAHPYQFLVIISDVLLNNAEEHIVGIKPIDAVLIHIFQQSLLAVVPDEDIVQIFPYILCKERYNDIRLPGFLIKADEVWVFHLGAVESAVARFDACVYGTFPVILPFPFLTVKRGGAEHFIDCRRVWAGAERYHGAEGCVRLGLGAVIAEITVIIQFGELFAVLLFSQVADSIEQCPVPVTLCAVAALGFPAHIFIQRCQNSLCAVTQGFIHNSVACENGITVRDTTHIQFHAVVRILGVELLRQTDGAFAVCISGNLPTVTFPIDVQSLAADRFLRIRVVPLQHELHERVCQCRVVDVQKEITLWDNEPDTVIAVFLRCRLCLLISDPCVCMGGIRACRSAISGDGLLCPAPLDLGKVPAYPYFLFHQFLHVFHLLPRQTFCCYSSWLDVMTSHSLNASTGIRIRVPMRMVGNPGSLTSSYAFGRLISICAAISRTLITALSIMSSFLILGVKIPLFVTEKRYLRYFNTTSALSPNFICATALYAVRSLTPQPLRLSSISSLFFSLRLALCFVLFFIPFHFLPPDRLLPLCGKQPSVD